MTSIPFEMVVRVELPCAGRKFFETRFVLMDGYTQARNEPDNKLLERAFKEGKVYSSVIVPTFQKDSAIYNRTELDLAGAVAIKRNRRSEEVAGDDDGKRKD